jgi:hypothetical protein
MAVFPDLCVRRKILILEILQCIPVAKIFAFLDLEKNISFSDSLKVKLTYLIV